jgi:hypothetical protein
VTDSGFSSDEPALLGQAPERSFRANDSENGCGTSEQTIAAAILPIALSCHAAADVRSVASFNVKTDLQAKDDGITDDSASMLVTCSAAQDAKLPMFCGNVSSHLSCWWQ